MTTKELIELLKRLDPDGNKKIYIDEGYWYGGYLEKEDLERIQNKDNEIIL